MCIKKIDSLWLQVTDETIMQGKVTVEIFIDVYIWFHMQPSDVREKRSANN